MTRDNAIKSSLLYSKYANAVDPESAYELLERLGAKEVADKASAEKKSKAVDGCREEAVKFAKRYI